MIPMKSVYSQGEGIKSFDPVMAGGAGVLLLSLLLYCTYSLRG